MAHDSTIESAAPQSYGKRLSVPMEQSIGNGRRTLSSGARSGVLEQAWRRSGDEAW
jgi:hypothetical protein